MTILHLLVAVGLVAGFLILAAYILNHSMQAMLKGIKAAFQGELKTDAGRVNLVGMLLFVFLYIFSDLHQLVANVLSVEKPAPAENHVIVGVLLFGLGFVLSLICVMVVESKKKNSEPKSGE
jgi:hypothetical protein